MFHSGQCTWAWWKSGGESRMTEFHFHPYSPPQEQHLGWSTLWSWAGYRWLHLGILCPLITWRNLRCPLLYQGEEGTWWSWFSTQFWVLSGSNSLLTYIPPQETSCWKAVWSWFSKWFLSWVTFSHLRKGPATLAKYSSWPVRIQESWPALLARQLVSWQLCCGSQL